MSLGEYISGMVTRMKQYWESLDIKQWLAKLGGSSSEMMEASVACGLFFAIGFFFKRYFKTFFLGALLFMLIIKILEYNAFVTIHWDSVQTALGLAGKGNLPQLTELAVEWVKKNALLFGASLVGFLIGYKLG